VLRAGDENAAGQKGPMRDAGGRNGIS